MAKAATRQPSSRRAFTAIFDDAASARRAIQDIATAGQQLGRRPTLAEFTEMFNGSVGSYEGDVIGVPRSTSQRETRVYGYQDRIRSRDYYYLSCRDPTTYMLLDKPALDTWCRMPMAFDPMWDDWLQRLTVLGLPAVARYADFCSNRDGGGFLYINASGDVSKRLKRGDYWFGFDFIPLSSLAAKPPTSSDPAYTYLEQAIIYDESGDPLLQQHGIESLAFFATEKDRERNEPTIVHGSRIVSFCPDPISRYIVSASRLEPVYDDLWNLRDVVYALKRAQLGGNPIVIEIDSENFDFDEEKAAEAEDEFKEFEDGHLQAFSPLYGSKMKRIGSANLDDAENIVSLLASRISNAIGIPFNMVVSTSKGSVKVEDGDYIAWESYVAQRRAVYAEPIMSQLAKAASASGELRQRPNLPDFPVGRLRWPHLRTLNAKDEALMVKNYATIIKTAYQSGRLAPEWVLRQFPKNLEPIDPELVLPNAPKAEDPNADDQGDDDEGPIPPFPPTE